MLSAIIVGVNKMDSTLTFWRRDDYIRLTKYLERKSKNSETLKQLLLNTGVASLNYSDSQSDENYVISKDESIEPEKDKLYSLYLQNRYFELLRACDNEEDILKSCFYEVLVKGYDEVIDKYKQATMTSFITDEKVAFLHNSEILNALKCIVGSSGFSTLVINCDRNLLRRLLLFFCPKMDHQNDLGIKEIIDSQESAKKKIYVLSLLYKGISTDAVKKEYQQFLSENFSDLDIAEIYEFVFSGWVLPTKGDILCFTNKLLEESKRQEQGTYQFPDRVAMRLECLYILFINGVIDDLNMIRSLKEGRPHLQFILDPEHFDYSKVDFSDYMWENFARRPRFMKYFVKHMISAY